MKPKLWLLAIVVAGLALGCSLLGGGEGTLRLKITDSPIELDGQVVEQINVTIIEVKVSRGMQAEEEFKGGEEGDEADPDDDSDAEWITISDEEQEFDLMELRDGATEVLGEAELDAGRYNQIRLVLQGNNTIKFEGDETLYDLKIPSGTQSGVKLTGGFYVENGKDTEITVDFDADKSVKEKGGGDTYKLKPTIKIKKVKTPE